VAGATGIAAVLRLDPFVVGATLVALGTSVPELATTLVARLRQHEEVGLGTLLGSNLFNGLFIVGVAVLIRPTEVGIAEIAASAIVGAVLAALVRPGHTGVLPAEGGALLLLLYVVYVAAVVQYQPLP
jgi:cation:H+ antiporter